MNESQVTLQGWVGNDVELRDVGETSCASFRVGSTPRFNKGGVWTDGETSWFTVNCWRGLGRNVADSVRKGDAVVVHGRVRVDVWEREEGKPPSVSWIVDATFVGHDLTRGTSSFAKTSRSAVAGPDESPAVREMLHSYDAAGPQLDSAGNEVEPAA
jgi:single-strand DNA-binding protein